MSTTRAYVSEFDGLRAIAIFWVLAVHAGAPLFSFGWLGVDLFFALSGFLITTLLMKEYSTNGHILIINFWVRRFLRLMPAYIIYILFITAAIWLWEDSIKQENGGWSPFEYTLSLWLYVVNYAPKGGIWNGQDITIHLWSLAVEEQYYLIWPLIMMFFIGSILYLRMAAWLLFFLVLGYFIFLADSFEQANMLYARGMVLFLASAVAISLYSPKHDLSSHLKTWLKANANSLFLLSLASVALVAFILETNIMSKSDVVAYILPLIDIFFVLLVASVWYSDSQQCCLNILNQPILVYIGKISYGIYIYHELVRVITWEITESLVINWDRYFAYGFRFALYCTMSISIATVSYYYLEKPFLKLKNRYR